MGNQQLTESHETPCFIEVSIIVIINIMTDIRSSVIYDESMKHPIFMVIVSSTCIALLGGCANTQEQLQSSQQSLADCEAGLHKERRTHQERLGQAQKHLEECQLSSREIISDKDAARLREAELRKLLRHELDDQTVELEYLKGRLTVRMLDRILFESGSAHILSTGKQVLDKLMVSIANTQDLIRVVGHTDDVRISATLQRKYPSNWELSAARASSVVRYFQQNHGVDPLRMEAVGLSKYRPVTDNIDEVSRQRNRRVEIVLTTRDEN